jgi:ligand-binding SRPBCC domain-containing protein
MNVPPAQSTTVAPSAPFYEVHQEQDERGYLIRTRQFLPCPQAEIFAFFENPANLARITPPWLRFRVLNPEAPAMASGLRIDYTIFWLGIPLGWTTLISGYDPPHFFEDTQARGPYARWVHQHRFREADGGTWIEDEISYRLPFGPLGKLVNWLMVGRQLRAIFEFRGRAIQALLAPSTGSQKLP